MPGDHAFPDVSPQGLPLHPTSTSFTWRVYEAQMCTYHFRVKMMKVNERRPKNVTARGNKGGGIESMNNTVKKKVKEVRDRNEIHYRFYCGNFSSCCERRTVCSRSSMAVRPPP